MGKSLSEMSLEELWELFPIILKEHNPAYKEWYLAEKVYHLHVLYYANWDELYFLDYLIAHKEVANEYGKLKLSRNLEINTCQGHKFNEG